MKRLADKFLAPCQAASTRNGDMATGRKRNAAREKSGRLDSNQHDVLLPRQAAYQLAHAQNELRARGRDNRGANLRHGRFMLGLGLLPC